MTDWVIVACDGSSKTNPGPAGWAWYADETRYNLGGAPHATNNWGELMALHELLIDAPDDVALSVHLDSAYVLGVASSWRHGWRERGWVTSTKTAVRNLELVQEIDLLLRHRGGPIQFVKVKAHQKKGLGDPHNEAADRLAGIASGSFQRGEPCPPAPGWSLSDG